MIHELRGNKVCRYETLKAVAHIYGLKTDTTGCNLPCSHLRPTALEAATASIGGKPERFALPTTGMFIITDETSHIYFYNTFHMTSINSMCFK